MAYFVTGGTGFIGRNLIKRLLERDGDIYVLVREGSRGKLEDLKVQLGDQGERVKPVVGDLTAPLLGCEDQITELDGKIDHFFHLGAIYDMSADAASQQKSNVEGTREAVALAERIEAKHFHMTSSIAAAGLYPGTFTEGMFDEAVNVDSNPYFQTKHESEAVVRDECEVPWRVYRPGIVVGDSETGEIDKIDGPYYFFKAIQRLRSVLPQWFPSIGIEGGEINIVPVDFVADAMDHIAHLDGLDGETFHLTDPSALSAGQVVNVLAKAAHAPEAAIRIDSKMFDFVPSAVRAGVGSLPPVKRISDQVLDDLGIPRNVLFFLDYPTKFDSTNTQKALEGSGISAPPLATYAPAIWDYWERNLDPDLFKDRSLSGAIGGKVVMITGASSGIGLAAAEKCAAAGATVVLVARSADKLEETRAQIEEAGGKADVRPCDLTDLDDIERMASEVLEEYGRVDVLVNNAGRSIRRSVELSYDRFHDFERTMQLNYFGALKLTMALLPAMRKKIKGRKGGHIVNVSSIGVQTNVPRFSAYVASKSALDAWSRCVASEMLDDGVHITTIHMPLVRTPMIAPTGMYDAFPTLTPEEAAEMITEAMITKPKKVATRLGNFGELLYAIAPKASDAILNTGYKLFPESKAAKGESQAEKKEGDEQPSGEAVAFAYLMRGVHW